MVNKPSRRVLVLIAILVLNGVFAAASLYADEIAPGIFRTPEERFANLQDFPFEPNYMQIGDYRVHYLAEGPANAAPVLLLHGEPTWSYLYREMIPIITEAGYRAVARDLIGMGFTDVAHLATGIGGWAEAGEPIEDVSQTSRWVRRAGIE